MENNFDPNSFPKRLVYLTFHLSLPLNFFLSRRFETKRTVSEGGMLANQFITSWNLFIFCASSYGFLILPSALKLKVSSMTSINVLNILTAGALTYETTILMG